MYTAALLHEHIVSNIAVFVLSTKCVARAIDERRIQRETIYRYGDNQLSSICSAGGDERDKPRKLLDLPRGVRDLSSLGLFNY